MLETSQERIKLLKAGLLPGTIEELYLKSNNFKIINTLILFDPNEICPENHGKTVFSEAPKINAL